MILCLPKFTQSTIITYYGFSFLFLFWVVKSHIIAYMSLALHIYNNTRNLITQYFSIYFFTIARIVVIENKMNVVYSHHLSQINLLKKMIKMSYTLLITKFPLKNEFPCQVNSSIVRKVEYAQGK